MIAGDPLPDDDEPTSVPEHDLFVVEGVSAANALKELVDLTQHRVLAMQGKPMNAARASARTVAKSPVAETLRVVIARGHIDNTIPFIVPFDRVILVTDGDVDGVHAKALLLLLANAVAPGLIESGKLFTVRAPEFAVRCAEMDGAIFAFSDQGKRSVIDQLKERGASSVNVKRFKGLASMDADDLWEVFVNPQSRKLTTLGPAELTVATNALSR